MEVIEELAEMGVFGLTIPEEYGGFGLSKASMCVVSEELSRGYIGVGSLGTRTEIAAELIICGGTEEQKQKWLPRWPAARRCPPPSSPSPTPGRTWAACAPARVKDDDGLDASPATRPGSPMPRAPM
jgi:(2S)-methylsuccinyl-CoA dehydrogenase